jgi:CBS-domain-containing membrane protein
VSAFAGAGCLQVLTQNNLDSITVLLPEQADVLGAVFPCLAVPASVSIAIAAMLATRTMHPPAAATAMLAVAGPPEILALGMSYPLFAGAGSSALVGAGLVLNKLRGLDYPKYWL